ncbi:glycosyltransferase [Pectinatus brassicae]|uniref:Glycosyltransferase involved in cell wall biosynthesis n=1 Tax=Pectinatus brassicae TaxID=862415 RepID=A0A840UFP7_9FIRM|nr:glycosyltransferase [Pectinatus brassicae]MBB5335926.1 glycosyltransferase involved in cell wall biosynthesis [Pectinatus brassicae]
MNILILFTQPWRTGGAETHVEALIKGLAKHNIILAVNTNSDTKKLQALSKHHPNIRIVTIQSRGINFFSWYRSFIYLKNLLNTQKIDIIACQQRTAGIWAYLLSKNSNIQYTITMHDPWHRAKLKKLYPRIFPQMIAVSKNLALILEKEYHFKQEHIEVINNGIDFSSFYPHEQSSARQQLGLPLQKKLILHVSRMSNVKGAVSLLIIDTMHYLAKKGQFYNTVLIGEGPLRSQIENKVNEFNAQYGQWLSVKNFVTDISTWYNASDILIGEGRVAIECLACQKPVIAIRNIQSFIGLITKQNIGYACDVNFDGHDKPATMYSLSDEINNAFSLPSSDSEFIAQYIKKELNIDKMTEIYLNIFTKMIKNMRTDKEI